MKITKDYLKRIIKEELKKNLRESLVDEFNDAAEMSLSDMSGTNTELEALADAVINQMDNGLSAQKAKELLDKITHKADGRGGETSTADVINIVTKKDPEKGRKLKLNSLR
jgi:hypothetical protein